MRRQHPRPRRTRPARPRRPGTRCSTTTANHPWLTADHGWLPAGFLHVGEPVRRADGGIATVVAIQVVPGVAAMWDLSVANVHTFAVGAGEYVVHNNCGQNNTFIGQRMQRRVDDDLLEPPRERGQAPIEKATGRPIEIHHVNQDPNGPFEEMTAAEHRGPGNYAQNHPFRGQPSQIDRELFNQQRTAYWAAEWNRGRWGQR